MNKPGPRSAHRMLLFLRHVILRPAPLAAWLGLPLSFAAFAALTGASIRLMLSAGSMADGLAALAGVGPSVAGAVMPLVEPVVIVATLLVIRILTNPATAVPLLLIEPRRTRLFLTLCADIALYYLPPVVVANLPGLRMLHEWLPSIAGTAIVESRPAINPILSGAIALAYVVIAVAVAGVSLNRRDVG